MKPFAPANSVLAEGQFTASTVGAYELKAWATSAGGDGQSAPVVVSVNYAMSWLPPISQGRTFRGNGNVVIKFDARDCLGNFVADSSVRVEVWEAGVQKAVYGVGSDTVKIQQDDEQYMADFKPATGSHTYTVKVFFNNYLQASTNFVTQ